MMNIAQSTVEKYITSTDGVQIYATAAGNSSLPAIVLVHGLACSALMFSTLLQNKDLLSQFYMVAYDLRGNGRSGKPDTAEGYISSLLAADFDAVSRAFNLQSPLFLGWSFGGTITADIFTHLPPSSISGIVYVAATPLPFEDVRKIVTPFVVETSAPGFTTLTNATAALATRLIFVESLVNEPQNLPTELKWAWIGNTVLTSPSQASLLARREQDYTALYEAGTRGFPVLSITGGRDKFIRAEPLKEELQKRFTNLTNYHIPEGSHAMFYDSQREFVRALVDFATSVLL